MTYVLLMAVIFLGTFGALADNPTYEESLQICKEERRKCVNDIGYSKNPYRTILYGCDSSKENGMISLKEWKQCREWCEDNYRSCLEEAKNAFGKK